MGKLDFSFIDHRHVKKDTNFVFGGKLSRCQKKIHFLETNNIPYVIKSCGNVRIIIDANNRQTTYMETNINTKELPEIIKCCNLVSAAVTEFMKKNGALPYGEYVSQFSNEGNISQHLVSGNKRVALVDINHCFWKILHNAKVINDDLYEKYKHTKDSRLVSVGSLNKATTITTKINGVEKKEVFKNPKAWVWKYVSYQSYLAVTSVKDLVNNNIFSYNTDGIYMPEQYAELAAKHLESIGLPSKVVIYDFMGKCNHFSVLKNVKTGKYKRANLGKLERINVPFVDFEELKKLEDEQEA